MSQISNIAKPTRYPTQSELNDLKLDYESQGYEVYFPTPITPDANYQPTPLKPMVHLCRVCGCKIESENCKTCGTAYFPF